MFLFEISMQNRNLPATAIKANWMFFKSMDS